jgi:hypothetical protein
MGNYLKKNVCRFVRLINCTRLFKLNAKLQISYKVFSFIKILKYAYLLASRKHLSFCLRSFEKKPYLLPFTYPPDAREKKVLFSDAWAIVEACVGFCVGFTYAPSPIRRTLLYFTRI